jgi:integrase
MFGGESYSMMRENDLADKKKEYQSKDGYSFRLNDPIWKLNKDINIHVVWAQILNHELHESYLNVLAYYSENYSADHTANMNSWFKRYIDQTGNYNKILNNSLISYRSSLEKEQEHYLGALRGFIYKWYQLGYPGVSKENVDVLKGWVLKGNEKGKAVALLDPEKGPLTDIEMEALLSGLLSKYMSGEISLEQYTLTAIFAHSGRRSSQITSLKIKDIIRKKNNDIYEYTINFPRGKQRTIKWREEFNSYPITEDLWLLIDLHTKDVLKRIQRITDLKFGPNIIDNIPLFPNYDNFTKKMKLDTLHDQLKFDYLHMPRNICNTVFKKVISTLGINSERTGSLLKLTGKRFRYTLGTNLAREGKGEYLIAEALDHSDTQNVGVYVGNIPEIVDHIDKAVAFRLAPLAQAFQGLLVDSEKDATRGNDMNSRIGNGKVNVGTCGSYGFCIALPPIACYTCKHFQPWLDAPHESILEDLLEKRKEILSVTKDIKMASINDRLILAVSDVILRCERRKAEGERS